MGDHKRSAVAVAAMEASSEATTSKKRKTDVGSCELKSSSSDVQLQNSHLLDNLQHMTVSPVTSVNSAGTVVSGELSLDRFPLSCCSSNETSEFAKNSRMPLDLEIKDFETIDSTYQNFKHFRDEFSGDSEELTFQEKSSAAAVTEQRKLPKVKMPPKAEIEEFFAMGEKYEQKRFAEKYNYDIVKDMPLEGRYQWVRLN